MTHNDDKQPHSVGRELASGVFYTSVAKYAGVVVTILVTAVLARLFTPEEFGVVNIATVIIAFFAIFSDLGIGPAVIQHRNLSRRDLGGIFSLTLWSAAVIALLFFAASGLIASFYDDSAQLRDICRILALNLFFATANIVPNALVMRDKRFRFAAVRSLAVQVVGGAAGIAAAYAGAGIYALTINPVFSSLMLFAINYREYPLRIRLRPSRGAIRKVFSFSAYQFSFQLLNFFSRNLDKLLMGRYMSLSDLGYYDKSYRLMMMPLQNIAFVISPVMHPIFAHMQDDLKKLGESYLKVIRLLAFIGLPLSAVLWFTAEELVLIIFGGQWMPSVAAFRILALSVGIQIVMSTSGSIFQAANATRMLFICGLFSATLNVTAICTGIFAFGTLEAVAWAICLSFAVNFVQCYHALFCLTLRMKWGPFWKSLLSPLLLTAILALALAGLTHLLPAGTPLPAALAAKSAAAAVVWLAYVQLGGVYDLKELAAHLRPGK
ncbi:lipopolysaccharide biosynthesis protein [Alistipes sp. i18-0019-D1]|uniref:lipopolysaccharide biosynthesis protein n=1 Tax=Alistipes sp. i18-0019-D1 TaxID=3132707 RepID=UPI0036F4288E